MAVVLDGPLDEEAASDLVSGLRTVLDDVRAVDEDAERLRARVLELAGRLDELAGAGPAPASDDPADDPAEAAALLRWLADGNFVFLGARDVDLVAVRGKPSARAVPGTGLGVLRSDTDMSVSGAVVLPGGRRDAAAAPGRRHQGRRPLTGAPPRLAGPGRGEHPVGGRRRRAAVPLRRSLPLRRVHERRARRAARAPTGGRGDRPLRRAGGQPHRQGAARRPRDLPARRAPAGRLRRAAAGGAGRAAPAGTPADPAVPPPGPHRPVLVGAGLPPPGPVHDRGAAGHAAAAAGAARRHERRVHGAVDRVGPGATALRRPRPGRHPRRTPSR